MRYSDVTKATAIATVALALCAGGAHAAIVNGGFETGDFTGWTTGGFGLDADDNTLPNDDINHTTANFLDQHDDADFQGAGDVDVLNSQTTDLNGDTNTVILPTAGDFLAAISNGGDDGLEGSFIFQPFVATGTALFFDTRFLSNEEIDSEFDFGGVALLDDTGNILNDFTLDHDPGTGTSPTDAHATDTEAGGFDDSTPWLTESFDLGGLTGQTLTLLAYATNTGDEEVESRLLLDNVRELGTQQVPEPPALPLLGAGIAALAFFRRRRRA